MLLTFFLLTPGTMDKDAESVEKMLQDEDDNGVPPAGAINSNRNVMVDKHTSTAPETTSTGTDTRSVGDSSAASGQAALPKIYSSIRAAKLSSMTVRTLGGCAVENFKGVGSFKDDPRFGQTNSRFSYDTKLNLSTSFKLKDLKCNTCPEKGPHTVLFPNGGGHDKTNQSPRCFVFTDQNFPPASCWGGGMPKKMPKNYCS
jgi:hypothetical protein